MLDERTLQAIEKEILAGLPNEQERIGVALKACDYYQLRGAQWIPYREAEQDYDYQLRPKKSLPFTRRVVDVLTKHLYGPGPSRNLQGQPEAAAWLNAAYADNLANSLWQRADRASTLNGLSMFQAGWTGDLKRPIKLQLWGYEQLCVYPDPEDVTRPGCVITIDRFDNTTRYTWWTEAWMRVYTTEKLRPGQTAGGRVTQFRPDLSAENPYGIVPFSAVHFDLPTSDFETPGLGRFLSQANGQVDVEASDLAEAVQKYHKPLPVAYDCDVAWNVVSQAGKFVRVESRPTDLENAPQPRLEYLQANLDIAGGWESIRQTLNTVLDGLGVPLTAYRMEQGTLPSGIALVAEQAPLLDRAKERQEPFRRYECELAKVVLAIGAKMTGRPDLTKAAADCQLLLAWPEPTIPIPGPERDQSDQNEIELGISSTVMVAMRRFGLTRDQAIEHIRQVAKDNAEVATIFPDGLPGSSQDQNQDPEPKDGPDDTDDELDGDEDE